MIETLHIDGLQLLPDTGAGVGGLLGISGLGSPAPRPERVLKSRAHGEVDLTALYGGRVIGLLGYCYGPDMATAHSNFDILKNSVKLGSTHLLKFRRIGQAVDEQVSVRVASAVESPFAGASMQIKWSVELFAADPRIYSSTLNQGDYDPTTAGTAGVELPLVFPLDFLGSGLSNLIVSNGGNFPTEPTFTISGPIVNPIIDNDTSGESLFTSGLTMIAGDSAVVDMAAKTFLLNGALRMDYVLAGTSKWFSLQPGETSLRLRGSGTSGGQTNLLVTFRDAKI